METNQLIANLFDKLYLQRLKESKKLAEEGDIKEAEIFSHKAKRYQQAIPVIRNYPTPFTSGKEAQQIHGIGKSMGEKIDEILRTGTLAELNQPLAKSEESKVIDLFNSIHRVGEKTAKKWYDAGYRSLKDIPLETCTYAQRIGIQLYSDFQERIPRLEVDLVNQELLNYLVPRGIYFQICGSYRRGRPDCGDIDVLVIAQEGRDVLTETLQCPIFTHTLACGQKKFLGVCRVAQKFRRIDVEVVQPVEYPFAVVYFTGSGRFNQLMREHCAQHGYRLNEKSLTKDGHSFIAQTEEEVFAMMGLKYLTPEERDLI